MCGSLLNPPREPSPDTDLCKNDLKKTEVHSYVKHLQYPHFYHYHKYYWALMNTCIFNFFIFLGQEAIDILCLFFL